MKKLALIALAASAVSLPTGAFAQVSHSTSMGAGHSFRGGGNVMVRHRGGQFGHPGQRFRHQRLQRGFVMHPFWFGPQFHVQNWQLYGFAPPPRDHRWVRHYDDAYLIDREGRVADTRYGLDWDEYGERWDSDEGIPHYEGRGDWNPDERDYAWFERHGYGGEEERQAYGREEERHGFGREEERYGHGREEERYGYGRGEAGWDYGEYGRGEEGRYAYGGGHVGAGPGCHPAPPTPCGGYGYGYGGGYGYGYYGYGVAYPIIIETTVVTGGASYVEEVTEEVVEVRERQRRPYRPRPRPRPRPPAGERG